LISVSVRPRWLWASLFTLVAALLLLLVWLSGRYEASQVQDRLERDALEVVGALRGGLMRNNQTLQAAFLDAGRARAEQTEAWTLSAERFLLEHRETVRMEWRTPEFKTLLQTNSPYRSPVFSQYSHDTFLSELMQTCTTARRLGTAAFSPSYFVPMPNGMGLELMDVCLPVMGLGNRAAPELRGYVLVSYALQDVLDNLIPNDLARNQDISFTEGDGTRLAMRGAARRTLRNFTALQLLDLPGNTLVVRLESWRDAPGLFPNVLTALVMGLFMALMAILWLLSVDMRRRLKAERELADALAFRKAMEDSLVTGLRARDLQGRITYVNPAFCQMVGFSAEELMGLSANAPYWPPELAEEIMKRHAVRLAGNSPPREGFESVFMRKDGSRFPVLIIEAPLINAQGDQTGWMSAFLDISEQRRVEELSRASQDRLQATARLAMVGEMASLLSHELNQPLAAISSYATGSLNMIKSGLSGPADVEQAMQRIALQAERAGKVIKSVNDFVRRRDQARESTQPQALLDAVLPLIRLQARKLYVQVQVRLAEGMPEVWCDRTMVEQVILNLARNAMQAMDQPGVRDRRLTLSVQPMVGDDPRWLVFSVADVGPGIAPDIEHQLFQPFFTTKAEGMGLGLSLCRTVVEQHGGTLQYAPNTPRGTVFSFGLTITHHATSD